MNITEIVDAVKAGLLSAADATAAIKKHIDVMHRHMEAQIADMQRR